LRAEIEAQIAAPPAELAASDGGVYEDPATGRWFVVLRAPGSRRTTTRRRGPDGRRLLTRKQALIAKGQWGRSWPAAAWRSAASALRPTGRATCATPAAR
jgi:hypothetical protein